ncbi:MAG: thiosulfate oxidation carrier protein SoxY [Hyphomicrobiaceae bacterium]
MTERTELRVIDRRDFVLGASSAAAFVAFLSAGAGSAFAAKTWQEAMKTIVGDAKPAEGKVSVVLPEIAENGNTVPFSVAVESPMSDSDYVKKVHVFATGNPRPDVASFSFSPASGKAAVSSRMRLGKTQDVIAVAEMSNGKFYMAKRTVKVTIGGCGG